ncbi:MAG: hypothetical protein LC115_02995 [Bacteroidia bacterium]|nr:hypothetical protein [Bacteroidia bacterium]
MKKLSKFLSSIFTSNSTNESQTTKLLAIDGEFVRPGQVPTEILKNIANYRILVFLKDKNQMPAWNAVFVHQKSEFIILQNPEAKTSSLLTYHVVWETAFHKYAFVSIVTGISTLKNITPFFKLHNVESVVHYISEENKFNRNKTRTNERNPTHKNGSNVEEQTNNKDNTPQNTVKEVHKNPHKQQQPKDNKPKVETLNSNQPDLQENKTPAPVKVPATDKKTALPKNTELNPDKKPALPKTIEIDKELVTKFLEHLQKQVELNVPIRKGYIGTLVNQATSKPSVEVFQGGVNALVAFLVQHKCITEIDRQTCSFINWPNIELFNQYSVSSTHNNSSAIQRPRNPNNRRRPPAQDTQKDE